MAFSYAVIRHDGDGYHLSVNDFAATHEVTKKTLDEILKDARRLIQVASKPQEGGEGA